MTKIDLNDIESRARAAIAEDDSWYGDIECGQPWSIPGDSNYPLAKAYIESSRPAVMLALVARIRELEDTASDYARDLDGEGYERMADGVRAVIAKGVVLE